MILQRLFTLERDFGVPLITVEMQAIVFLFRHGPVPSLTLQSNLRISPSGFYGVQRRLKEQGIIAGQPSEDDLRVTLYDLTPAVRQAMEAAFRSDGGNQPINDLAQSRVG